MCVVEPKLSKLCTGVTQVNSSEESETVNPQISTQDVLFYLLESITSKIDCTYTKEVAYLILQNRSLNMLFLSYELIKCNIK